MKLGDTVTYCSLEGVSLCEIIPMQYASARCLWWEIWIWCEKSHVFPQCVLATINLVGTEAGYGVVRARDKCKLGLLLCSFVVMSLPYWGGGGYQVAWTELLRFGSELAHFPLSVCSPSTNTSNFAPEGSTAGARGAGVGICHTSWHCCGNLPGFWDPDSFWCAAHVSISNGCPCSVQMLLWIWAASVSHSWTFTLVWSCFVKKMGLEGLFSSGWDMHWGSHEKPASHWNSFQSILSALLLEQVSVYMLFMSRVQVSHIPLVSPTGPPTSQMSSSSLCRTPGVGTQYVAWLAHSKDRIVVHVTISSEEHRFRLDCFSSLPIQFHVDFSYRLGCRGVFLSVSS